MTKTKAAMVDQGNDDSVKGTQTTAKTDKESYVGSSAKDVNDDDDDLEEHNLHVHQGYGRGIVADVKRTILVHWKEEMMNFNSKTIACSFFLYFACIAPAVTFGAIYGKATNNNIGAVEMIAATAWCGIFYSLAGGQPMMINGGTGPVLAFTEILYKMSESMDVPFLTLNAWIGIWVCIYMVLAAVVDLNRIIVLCTRFTDEIFSFLIALIFIINAIGSPFSNVGVLHYFDMDHKAHDPYEDQDYYSHWASALFSLIVFIGTTQLAFQLRKFKFSPFLPNQTCRNSMTDFAVVISILVWSLIGNSISEVPIEKLNVPSTFNPTFQCCDETCQTSWPNDCYGQEAPYSYRSWVVDLGNLNGKSWVPFMAAGPALLAFILVFLDDGITWHLINHPQHKMKHGEAYNYDTIIIGVMILVNSFLGFPWLVAATVRSLNHIHAMAEKDASGKFLSVQETRLTNLGIHLLCLVTIFALDVLKLIPVPVLYGVFLFMGLVSLGSNQFWGRMLMFFMQPSKYPVQPYTQYMKPKRMHLFTLIQLFFFALLYTVKSIKTIAIAFPILIALCIPIRLYALPKIFTEDELILIDSDPKTVKTWIAHHEEEEHEEELEHLIDDSGTKDTPRDESKDGDIESQLAGAPKKAPPRGRRKKTMSCPNGALMFSEEPSVLGPQLRPQMIVRKNTGLVLIDTSAARDAANASNSDASDMLEGMDPRPRRSRRQRVRSCPLPGMMFVEPQHIDIELSGVDLPTGNEANKNQVLPTLHEAHQSQHSQ